MLRERENKILNASASDSRISDHWIIASLRNRTDREIKASDGVVSVIHEKELLFDSTVIA
jgi:hypothetical protein